MRDFVLQAGKYKNLVDTDINPDPASAVKFQPGVLMVSPESTVTGVKVVTEGNQTITLPTWLIAASFPVVVQVLEVVGGAAGDLWIAFN